MLQALGLSAGSLAWAFGCGSSRPQVHRADGEDRGEIRNWLRDGVARLAAVYPSVHALAAIHHRTTAAIDVLGTGVARARRDGAVFTVRDAEGTWREHVTNDLSRNGIRAAVTVLAGSGDQRASIKFPPPPGAALGLVRIDDTALYDAVAAIASADTITSSRIVYAAAMIDVDDVTTWSIAPDHDREQRVRRVRKRVTRAAWNGARPVVSELERGWTGELGDQQLSAQDVSAVSAAALLQMTPGRFEDGERSVVLAPSVSAAIVEIAVRGLFGAVASRRPEVARRLAATSGKASALLTLVDDPTVPGAYGGFAFDDEGKPGAPITLVEQGRITGRLARGRRAGHLGPLEPAPSHLALAPGAFTLGQLSGEGWLLEGRVTAAFDPSSDRIVIGVARARELDNGSETGRVFPEVELVTDLAGLLARVDGVGQHTVTSVMRDERGGAPLWRSIAAPHLRTRGVLRGRRLA